ncbi:HPP family protein [candidate division KSB1 bacterium]
MEKVLVSDIMIYLDEYPAVINTATIREVIEKMETFQITVNESKSLPRVILVLDKKDRLVGFVRRRDILAGLEPSFLQSKMLKYQKKLFDIKIDPGLSELSFETLIKGLKSRCEKSVSEIMVTDIITINYDDHLIKAINLMVENDITFLPVMNKNKVVGVARSIEVFREIAKYIL